jgi:Chalcone isomerase-like
MPAEVKPMQLTRIKRSAFLAAFAAVVLFAASLFAQSSYTLTGTGIRVKTIAFMDFNVYQISHYMKQLPSTRSRQAVIEMDTGKKLVWTMLRDVDHEKIVNALKDAYTMNGYSDAAKIGKFMGAFKGDLKEKSRVTIEYDSEKKSTTLAVDGGGSVTVEGIDFMKATWSIWFGKMDQPKLGDQLISKIP